MDDYPELEGARQKLREVRIKSEQSQSPSLLSQIQRWECEIKNTR